MILRLILFSFFLGILRMRRSVLDFTLVRAPSSLYRTRHYEIHFVLIQTGCRALPSSTTAAPGLSGERWPSWRTSSTRRHYRPRVPSPLLRKQPTVILVTAPPCDSKESKGISKNNFLCFFVDLYFLTNSEQLAYRAARRCIYRRRSANRHLQRLKEN